MDDVVEVEKNSAFKKNVRWQLIANLLQVIFGGAYLIALGRLLGPAQFGLFSVVSAVVLVFGQLTEFRIQDIVAKKFCDIGSRQQLSESEWLSIKDLIVIECFSRLIPVAILAILIYPITCLADLGSNGYVMLCVAGFGWIISKSGSSFSTGLVRVAGRTDYIAYCITLDLGLRLFGILLAWYLGLLSVITALIIAATAGFIGNGLLLMFAWRVIKLKGPDARTFKYSLRGLLGRVRSDIRFLGANIGLSLTDLMSKDLDIVLLSSGVSTAQIGVYKMAKSLICVIWRMIDPFYLAIMPEVQRLFQTERNADLVQLIRKTSRYLLCLSLGLVVCSYASLYFLCDILLGQEYSQVADLVLLMSSWVIICAPLIWGHPLAVAIDRPGMATWATLLGTFFGLGLLLILSEPFGIIGAGIAWSVSSMAAFSLTAHLSWKFYHLDRLISETQALTRKLMK